MVGLTARKITDDDQRVDHILYRQRFLPVQLERARAKVAALETEARRYGMTELLEKAQ